MFYHFDWSEEGMSNICIFNLKKYNMSFLEKNSLAQELVKIALKNDIGITFNDHYWEPILKDAKMDFYFTLSSTFLAIDSDTLGVDPILDLFSLVMDLTGGDVYKKLEKDKMFYNAFKHRFNFLGEMINEVFKFKVELLEIYISESGCEIGDLEDFEKINTTTKRFMKDLFNSVTDELNNKFNYSFDDSVFILKNDI